MKIAGKMKFTKFTKVIIFTVKVFLTFSIISCAIMGITNNTTDANWLNTWYSNATYLRKPFHYDGHSHNHNGIRNSTAGRKNTKRSIPSQSLFEYIPRSRHQELEESQQGVWGPSNYGWGWSPHMIHNNNHKELELGSEGVLLGLLGLKGVGIKVLKALIGLALALKCIASVIVAFKAGVFLSPILLPFLAPAYLGALLLPFVPLLVLYLVGRIIFSFLTNYGTTIINNITNTTTTTTTTTSTRSPNAGRSFADGYGNQDILLIDNILNSRKCVDKIICDIEKGNK